MAKIRYANQRLGAAKLDLITRADQVCQQYAQQGMVLTLRQVHYRFVAQNWYANTQANYNRLGDALSDGRMAGLIDWDHLIDRTRNLADYATWSQPNDILRSAASQYKVDLWSNQNERVEVWIEKDAGIGVIEGVCARNRVPYFSCRGYTSMGELWSAAQRIGGQLAAGSRVTILHVGDHDPSGLDMTRDIRSRLATFIDNDWRRRLDPSAVTSPLVRDSMRRHMRRPAEGLTGKDLDSTQAPWRVRRIALNWDQILQYAPPPNYAKISDSRYARYVEDTGQTDSWELDALEPSVLASLIQTHIDQVRDPLLWEQATRREAEDKMDLAVVASAWPQAVQAARAASPPDSNPFR